MLRDLSPLVGGNPVLDSYWESDSANFDSLRRRNRLIGSKGGEALDDPEHGDAADGVGRDEFGPARKWNADAAREDDQEHHHANEQEMAGLDAQAEEQ